MYQAPIFDFNLLDKYGNSMDKAMSRMNADIERLFLRSQVPVYKSLSDLKIGDSEATMSLVWERMPLNSMLSVEIYRGTQTSFDTPLEPSSGFTMSGRLNVIKGQDINKASAYFQTEYGVWVRHLNKLAEARLVDPGWYILCQEGKQFLLTASIGNKLSALKTPGKYYASSAIMGNFTDAPTTGGSYIYVEKVEAIGDIKQTVEINSSPLTSWRRHITSTGSVSPWIQTATSASSFTTSGDIITTGLVRSTGGGVFQGTTYFNEIRPNNTAVYNLGSATSTYNNIYSQNAVTVVSDRNYKSEISSIPDEVLDAWATINYSQWKLNTAIDIKGENARLHVGIVAQDIRDAFISFGLDATEYGILVHETWEEQEAVEYQEATYEEDGSLKTPEIMAKERVEAGEIWMVRMEECLSMESALQRRTTKRLQEQIDLLVKQSKPN